MRALYYITWMRMWKVQHQWSYLDIKHCIRANRISCLFFEEWYHLHLVAPFGCLPLHLEVLIIRKLYANHTFWSGSTEATKSKKTIKCTDMINQQRSTRMLETQVPGVKNQYRSQTSDGIQLFNIIMKAVIFCLQRIQNFCKLVGQQEYVGQGIVAIWGMLSFKRTWRRWKFQSDNFLLQSLLLNRSASETQFETRAWRILNSFRSKEISRSCDQEILGTTNQYGTNLWVTSQSV